MSKYADALIQWSDDMSEECFEEIKMVLDSNLLNIHKINISKSISENFINTGVCEIFELRNLSDAHAYCFLNDLTGLYQKEVNEAFDKDFQSAKEDGELSSYESSLDDDRE